MEDTYEVVWDGRHHGINADLLSARCDDLPPPRFPQVTDRGRGEVEATPLLKFLEAVYPRAVTLAELAHALEREGWVVWYPLTRLITSGLVTRVEIRRYRPRQVGRPPNYAYRATGA